MPMGPAGEFRALEEQTSNRHTEQSQCGATRLAVSNSRSCWAPHLADCSLIRYPSVRRWLEARYFLFSQLRRLAMGTASGRIHSLTPEATPASSKSVPQAVNARAEAKWAKQKRQCVSGDVEKGKSEGGIFGSGDVKSFGRGFLKEGHAVMLGSRVRACCTDHVSPEPGDGSLYAGWRNVFSALPVAKEVFEKRCK